MPAGMGLYSAIHFIGLAQHAWSRITTGKYLVYVEVESPINAQPAFAAISIYGYFETLIRRTYGQVEISQSTSNRVTGSP
jgi:hypothetical protein